MKTAENPYQYQIITLPKEWGYGYLLTQFHDRNESTISGFDLYRHLYGLSLPHHTPPVSPLLEGYSGRTTPDLTAQSKAIRGEYPSAALVIAALVKPDPDRSEVFTVCKKKLQTECVVLPTYRQTTTGHLEVEKPFLLALRRVGSRFAFGKITHQEGVSLIIRDGEKFNEIPSLFKQGQLAASFQISELGDNLTELLALHLQKVAEAKKAAKEAEAQAKRDAGQKAKEEETKELAKAGVAN